MLKFRVCIAGKNAQGIAVSKHEQVFTAELHVSEAAEKDVLEMVAKHIADLAKDLETAAEDARLVQQATASIRLRALLAASGQSSENATLK